MEIIKTHPSTNIFVLTQVSHVLTKEEDWKVTLENMLMNAEKMQVSF